MKQRTHSKIFALFLLIAVIAAPLRTSGGSALQESQSSIHALASCDVTAVERNFRERGSPDALPCSPAIANEQLLIPGGIPFGVKFSTEGILVVGFCEVDTDRGKVSPAYSAGLRKGDVIYKLNDKVISDAASLSSILANSGGKSFTVTFIREKNEHTVTVTPAYSVSEGKYKSGIWIRDSGAGIGTVTFIDPESGMFAGLGHGICDGDTGKLLPMDRGTVIDVTISGIIRGLPGTPGEVKGYFNNEKLGSVFGNTECGVFGLFSQIPASCGQPIPVGSRTEVHEGRAELLCSLDTDTVSRYDIRISAINPTSKTNKCFTVTVTDPDLIAKTGGIVQGMSGSPIIQNGKLVGAVTHVLINDPTTGYGIFIENMLNAANVPMAKAS